MSSLLNRRHVLKFTAGLLVKPLMPALSFAEASTVPGAVAGVAPEVTATAFQPLLSYPQMKVTAFINMAQHSPIGGVEYSHLAHNLGHRIRALAALYAAYSEQTLHEIGKNLTPSDLHFAYTESEDSCRINPGCVLVKKDRLTHQEILSALMATLEQAFHLNDDMARKAIAARYLHEGNEASGKIIGSVGLLDEMLPHGCVGYNLEGRIHDDLSEREKIELLLGYQNYTWINPESNRTESYGLYNTDWFDVPRGLTVRSYERPGMETPPLETMAQAEDPNLSREEFKQRGENLRKALDNFFENRALAKVARINEVAEKLQIPETTGLRIAGFLRGAGQILAGALRESFSKKADIVTEAEVQSEQTLALDCAPTDILEQNVLPVTSEVPVFRRQP